MSTVTRHIYCDEWYPVFSLDDEDSDGAMELSEEDLADYERVMREFAAWQKRLSDAYGTSYLVDN